MTIFADTLKKIDELKETIGDLGHELEVAIICFEGAPLSLSSVEALLVTSKRIAGVLKAGAGANLRKVAPVAPNQEARS